MGTEKRWKGGEKEEAEEERRRSKRYWEFVKGCI